MYKLDTNEYKKLTTEALTSTYKKAPDKINDKINSEDRKIMENKTTLNRMFIKGKNSCFIKSINGKTLMMSAVRSKASRTSEVVSLLDLI